MRVRTLDPKPCHRVRYLNAAKRGGVESSVVEVLEARVDVLPEGVLGIVATSDLQGVVTRWELGGETCLLGEALPGEVSDLADRGACPPPSAMGAILAGDLYSVPAGNKRGATGDVRSVWNAFADEFSWVAGVAGNHDLFGSEKEHRRLASEPNVALLDCETVVLGGCRFGGVGYIIGDPDKPGRRDRDDYLAGLELVLEQRPDVLILHSGPPGDSHQRGSAEIAAVLRKAPPLLVICGHAHWDSPLHELDNGTQVLNVDARAVVLTR